MALKFCAALFSSESPTSPASSVALSYSSSSNATVRSKHYLLKRAIAEIVLDAKDAKWEKEFRVHFDGSKPTGLGFEAANSSRHRRSTCSTRQSSLAPATSPGRNDFSSGGDYAPACRDERERYECVVREVVPEGLAAEYNAHCRGVGDYSRIISKGLRVRKVNNDDVADVSYDRVLQMMRAAMPAFYLTFADTSSKQAKAPHTLAAAVSLEPPSFRPRPSSSAMATACSPSGIAASPLARHNSSLGLSASMSASRCALDAQSVVRLLARRNSGSSIVHLHGGGSGAGEGSSSVVHTRDAALVSDLEAKSKDVSEQLQRAKLQLHSLETESVRLVLERDQAMQERDAIAAAKQRLEHEKLRLLEERDAAAATHQLLTSQRQSASDLLASAVEQEQREASRLESELTAARTQLAELKHEHARALSAQSMLQSKLVEQMRLCKESTKLVDELHHERDERALAWKELELEHADAIRHAEELHARLVDAQTQQTAAETQRTQLTDELERKSQQLSELVQGMRAILSNPDSDNGSSDSGSESASNGPGLARLLQHGLFGSPNKQQPLVLLQQARAERLAIEQQRDELLLETSRTEQTLATVRSEAETLASGNAALRDEIAALRSEMETAQRHQREQQSQQASEHFAQQQHAVTAYEELTRQVQTLESRCEAERMEKLQLRAALDALEATARARLDAHNKDQELLTQFKQQLAAGIVLTKHGSRGNPHPRVLFSDLGCHWMSWKAPSSSVSLASPRADAKVETRDLVEVLAGATTEVFQRNKPEATARCLSLVFVHPCRTLDLEAETPDRCQFLLRGFRLLHDEVTHKRRQES